MSGSYKKEDLRIKRTYKALTNAMLKTLNRKNFNQITVNNLCEEALISRATFYMHFNDKYDLLKYYLSNLSTSLIDEISNREEFSLRINQFIKNNKKFIENIIIDANSETLGIMNEFIETIVKEAMNTYGGIHDHNFNVLANFCTGGIFNLLHLLVKKNFPSGKELMTPYLYEMLLHMMRQDKLYDENVERGKDDER